MTNSNLITNSLEPKIYVACLASYNAGSLHGAWIDANQSAKEIYQAIHDILKTSPIPNAEEWAIHDYDDFGEMRISENEGVEEIVEYGEIINEHDAVGAAVLAYCGNDINNAKGLLDEYHGCYDSNQEFAEQLFNDCYDVPDHLAFYIDYEKFSRDLFIGDYLSLEADNKVHVFCCV